MIEAILKSLDPIFNEMDWVKRYGGLAETWTREAEGPEGSSIQESYPVVIGTDPSCDGDCHVWLMPEDSKKNVLFWTIQSEAVVGPVPANISRSMKPVQITQTARLNVWLNFTGCETCDATSFIAYVDYLKAVLHEKRFSLTVPVHLKGQMKATGVPSRSHSDVWGSWFFGRDQKLFVHPFDFFALDFTFVWTQNQSCPVTPTC